MNLVSRKPSLEKTKIHLFLAAKAVSLNSIIHVIISWFWGGAGSGKTASIGKPILEQYIRYGWAGFIYDYKDYDYTKTAWNLVQKYKYPYKFYYISFTDMSRTYRFNILNKM